MSRNIGKVHPVLIRKINKIIEAMAILGFRMMITDGERTAEKQNLLYQQGRTRAGNKVTNADGYKVKSNHQAKTDGYGYAVDLCFLDGNGQPTWDMSYPWKLYGEMCKTAGLKHGIKLGTNTIDWPHAELPENLI